MGRKAHTPSEKGFSSAIALVRVLFEVLVVILRIGEQTQRCLENLSVVAAAAAEAAAHSRLGNASAAPLDWRGVVAQRAVLRPGLVSQGVVPLSSSTRVSWSSVTRCTARLSSPRIPDRCTS